MTVVLPADRTLPYSLQAESACLGAVLAHGDLWPELAALVQPDDFFRAAHSRIYKAMITLAADGVAIDFITVHEALRRTGEIDEVGGPAYVSSLADGVPHSMNIRHYAAIVVEAARLRALVAAGNQLVEEAYSSGMPSAEIIDAATRRLLALASADQDDPVPIEQAVKDYLLTLDAAPSAAAIATGFRDLDELLAGGLRRKDLTIVAARPSVGKTAWAMNVALTAAQAQSPTVVFTREMSTQALAARAVASLARVDAHRMASRYLGERDHERLAAAWAALAGIPLLIQDTAATLTQIAAWCHRLRQRPEGLALAVVDYLQLLVPEARRRDLREDITAIARGLKQIAKDQDLAVVALSQLSRAPEGRTDKRPHLSDLRESGAIEEVADVAVLLFREEMHKPTEENHGIAECILSKHRNGPTGVVRLVWLQQYLLFADLALA